MSFHAPSVQANEGRELRGEGMLGVKSGAGWVKRRGTSGPRWWRYLPDGRCRTEKEITHNGKGNAVRGRARVGPSARTDWDTLRGRRDANRGDHWSPVMESWDHPITEIYPCSGVGSSIPGRRDLGKIVCGEKGLRSDIESCWRKSRRDESQVVEAPVMS